MRPPRRQVVRAIRTRLRDGTEVAIRPVRTDDARHADAFFDWLSEETRYMRFMYQVNEATPEIVANVLAQDGLKRLALVVEPVQQVDENPTPAVAVGHYTPTAC